MVTRGKPFGEYVAGLPEELSPGAGDDIYIGGATSRKADVTTIGGEGGGLNDAGVAALIDNPASATSVELASQYVALGDEGTTVAVATYSAGWPARPTADLVFWLATDVAATTPGAATGDDVVILSQDSDLTAIAALTTTAYGRAFLELASAATAAAYVRPAAATIADTTDTLAAGDDARVNIYSNASEVTVTLTNLTVGHETVLVAAGAGGLTLDTTGMTLIGSSPNLSIAQNEALFVKQTAASTWLVLGGTAA